MTKYSNSKTKLRLKFFIYKCLVFFVKFIANLISDKIFKQVNKNENCKLFLFITLCFVLSIIETFISNSLFKLQKNKNTKY